MATNLPWFKFIISEWNDGDITLCSMEAQGLFINLCSIYWSQEGDLSLTKAKRRYKECNTTVWDELINEKIIKVNGDSIVINFLDEQFLERSKLSNTNAENVRKRWEKAHSDTTVLQPNNDGTSAVYNKEEKREEEKKKEEKREETQSVLKIPFVELVLDAWNEWEQFRKEKKQKLLPSTIKKQIQFLAGRADAEVIAIINQSITAGYTGLFELNNGGKFTHSRKKDIRRSDAVVESGRDFGSF